MSQFPASPSDRPVTEATLKVELAHLETRLTDKIGAVQMRIFAILLPFIVAMNAIMVALVAGVK